MTRTHMNQNAHARPSGVPQESDPRLAPSRRGSCRRLNLRVSADFKVSRVRILFLRVAAKLRPRPELFLKLLSASVIKNVEEEADVKS